MMSIEKLDLWVLDNVYQRIADWVWERVPITCFTLARLSVLCWFAVMLFSMVSRHTSTSGMLLLLFFNSCMPLWCIQEAESKSRVGFVNPFRYGAMGIVRVLFALLLPGVLITFDAIFLRLDSLDVAVILGPGIYYFYACRTSPPPERKTAKFMRFAIE